MKSIVNKLENSRVEIIVDFTAEEWKAAQEKAFKKLAANLEVKGFRKGKAPESIAREKIEGAKIYSQALDDVLNPTFSEVLSEHQLSPMARPTYDVPKLSDTELQLKFIIVVSPEVELGAYKDLKVGHQEIAVDDIEIDAKIETLRTQSAELVVKEGAAELGDTAVIDFEGFKDGVAFEGGKGENHSLELGSNSFIPGFEEQVVGHQAGDEFEVTVTFPEAYTPELANQQALFKVKVHEVKVKKVPELSDEFAADLALQGVSDLASLRVHATEDLRKGKEQEERNRYIAEVLKTIRESSKIELASEIIADEAAHMKEELEKQISQSGLDMEKYLEMTNQKAEDVENTMKEEATRNIQNFLIIEKIADLEGFEATDELVDFEISKIAMQYQMEEAKVREIFGENMNRLKSEIRQRQTFDFLLENNQ
ncbi:MAG: trigger factor [Bacilli bacterium]|jgi:trigger factor|nr:trigger factor [Bacilli bacterium]MDD3389490.1 trigger factor [Bacilli bacterium]MDD4345106.1 trigger factor [Bacilli bacterium]MDD4521137.1 trigger factor [Bacilli bacterium]MDY0399853.1 trigger factor [Bacilli bacterium]